MFDDLTTNQSAAGGRAPENASNRATEDIFADVDRQAPSGSAKPAVFQPIDSRNAGGYDQEEESGGGKKYLVFAGIVLGVMVAIFLALSAYLRIVRNNSLDDQINNNPIVSNENKPGIVNSVPNQDEQTKEEEKPAINAQNSEKLTGNEDSDSDGLNDGDEDRFGTDKNLADTDGDGLFDREEIMIYNTDPLDRDTDNDGYSDGDEVRSGNDPLNRAAKPSSGTSGNGSIMPAGETLDSDGDGLSDIEEERIKTDPFSFDSDNDGLSDYSEVRIYGTNPLNPDTDGDGFNDGDEVKNGYNPKGTGRL